MFTKKNRPHTLNGIILVSLFALSSLYLSTLKWNAHLHFSPVFLAMIFGIFYGNTLHQHLPKEWAPGIAFCSKTILQIAIILYGFRITIQEVLGIGWQGILLDAFVVVSTIFLGIFLGKLLKLDRDTSLLIGSGSAICGAAAVLASEDVLKSEPYKATVGVITVVIFGTLAMFLYPLAQHLDLLKFSETQYGVFTGASIHEVAQAVVASDRISEKASTIAVIVKMTRVLLLIPVLFCFAFLFKEKNAQKSKIAIPWFALIFGLAIVFHSFQWLSEESIALINQVDIFLLAMAMAAIGMKTNLKKIQEVGLRPIYLAGLLFLWLIGSVYAIVSFTY